MASKWINVRGRVRWCKVYEPEEYAGSTRWITNFYPRDEREWKKIEDAGIQLERKESEEGTFIRLRRPIKKLFGDQDEITKFTPPKVTGAVNVSYVNDKTNEEVRSYQKSQDIDVKIVGDQTPIGNDSEVIVNICVYDTSRGKGHRWDGLNVLDLVEYVPTPRDEVEEEVKVEEKKEESKKVKSTKTKDSLTVQEDMNDKIPW